MRACCQSAALEDLQMVLGRGEQAGQLPCGYLAELILQELGY